MAFNLIPVELLVGEITTSQIAPGAVTTTRIAAGAVTSALLAAGAVDTTAIAAGAVTTAQIAAAAGILGAQIANGTLTGTNIAAGTITAGLLAAGIVVAGIVDGTLIEGAQFVAYGSTGEILVYSGIPAAGNLIGSWSAAAGSDGFGNTYPAGIAVSSPTLGRMFLGFDAGGIPSLFLATLNADEGNPAKLQIAATTGPPYYETAWLIGPTEAAYPNNYSAIEQWSEASDGSFSPGGSIAVHLGANVYLMAQWETPGGLVMYGQITATEPGAATQTAESWHAIPLSATWTAYGAGTEPAYEANGSSGMVDIKGDITFTATGAGGLTGSNVFTGATAIPADYLPATTQYFPAYVISAVAAGAPTITAGKIPIVGLSTGGQLTLYNVSTTGGAGNGVNFGFKGSYQKVN